MADKISATITYLDSNQVKGSKAITDISPNADNGSIKNFCVGLLGLTTNTLSQIDRVEKTDITSATTKPKLTLTLNRDLDPLVMKNMNIGVAFTGGVFDETSLPAFTYKVESTAELSCANFVVCLFVGVMGVTLSAVEDSRLGESPAPLTITIFFEETNTTAATTAQIEITSENKPTLTIL